MTNLLERDHPLTAKDEIQSILEEAEEVSYSRHFEEDVLPRRPQISKERIETYLARPEALHGFNHEPDDLAWPKYILLFDKSNKYWLKIVISLRESRIEVVTAHIASKRKNNTGNLLKTNR